MTTLARVHSFVQTINRLGKFQASLQSKVHMLIEGITATGSVVLSELLRPQVEGNELHAAEQRLSHALKHADELDQLPELYLQSVASTARTLKYRTVDGSDLSKPAGRAFEHLDVVRDGSCKPRAHLVVGANGVQRAQPPSSSNDAKKKIRPRTVRRKADHQEKKEQRKERRKDEWVKVPSKPALKKLGYWMVLIEAGDGKGNHLPLVQDVYSTQDPAYKALGKSAWNQMFRKAIALAIVHAGGGGIWLFDRGFESNEWMSWMHTHVEHYVVRLKANHVVCVGDEKPTSLKTLAAGLRMRHKTFVRYTDKSTHKDKLHGVSFTWIPIRIDGVGHPVYLVVCDTGRRSPLLLLTNRCPANEHEAAALIHAYLERWGSEEVTRACKQLTGLENIRVRSLDAIRRLVSLAMIAVGIQAMCILTAPQLTRAILDRASEFIRDVRFVLYRVFRVVREDFMRAFMTGRPLRE